MVVFLGGMDSTTEKYSKSLEAELAAIHATQDTFEERFEDFESGETSPAGAATLMYDNPNAEHLDRAALFRVILPTFYAKKL